MTVPGPRGGEKPRTPGLQRGIPMVPHPGVTSSSGSSHKAAHPHLEPYNTVAGTWLSDQKHGTVSERLFLASPQVRSPAQKALRLANSDPPFL